MTSTRVVESLQPCAVTHLDGVNHAASKHRSGRMNPFLACIASHLSDICSGFEYVAHDRAYSCVSVGFLFPSPIARTSACQRCSCWPFCDLSVETWRAGGAALKKDDARDPS